jgi:hypothetical protein
MHIGHMYLTRVRRMAVVAISLAAACARPGAPAAADSAATAAHLDDSILSLRTQHAAEFIDTARATMSVLLKHPESMVLDSLTVVQLPKDGGEWPTPYVCGRIGGRPGIGGRTTMTPFVYQSRVNVFLQDQANGTAFAALRARTCDNPAAHVLLRSSGRRAP